MKKQTDEAVLFSVSFKHGKKIGKAFEDALAMQRKEEADLDIRTPMKPRDVFKRMMGERKELERLNMEDKKAAKEAKKKEMERRARKEKEYQMKIDMLTYGKPNPTWSDKLTHFLDHLNTSEPKR